MSLIRNRHFGDNVSPLHRAALGGNAMLFNASRWVRLTSATDTIPNLLDIDMCYIVAFYPTNVSGDGNFNTIVSQNNLLSLSDPGREERICINNLSFALVRTISLVSKRVFVTTNNQLMLLKRNLSAYQCIGTSAVFYQQQRALNPVLSSAPANNRNVLNYIDIGRLNGLVVSQARFFGYIRSVEIIISRHLTPAELRRVFNYGTAHAAGLITAADISIDFNRVNGQAPICRPGSRQLTVTPYNNSTPDTAGTTYADYYSL